jgi:hypothetical protein
MNCSAIQKRLLACEQPDFPPLEVRTHLAQCDECRAVQQRVVQIEQRIGELPVPPSDARAAFVLRFLAGDEAFRPSLRPSPALRLKESGRLKAALAFALAAGLVVFALSWWAWPQTEPVAVSDGHGPTARPPSRLALLEIRIASARTPGERVRLLTTVVEELQAEARGSRGDTEKLAEVSRFCVQVVRDHLMTHARVVPKEEREELLTAVAQRLHKIESEASRLANDMQAQAAVAAEASYRDIALATEQTRQSLLKLARGEAA